MSSIRQTSPDRCGLFRSRAYNSQAVERPKVPTPCVLIHHKGDTKTAVASCMGHPGNFRASAVLWLSCSTEWRCALRCEPKLGLIFYQSPGGGEKSFHEIFQGEREGGSCVPCYRGTYKAFSQDLDSLTSQSSLCGYMEGPAMARLFPYKMATQLAVSATCAGRKTKRRLLGVLLPVGPG